MLRQACTAVLAFVTLIAAPPLHARLAGGGAGRAVTQPAPTTAPAPAPDATEPVVMRDNVAIPMRDGVTLRAMIALPAGGSGRWPAVLTLTPYQRDGGWSKARAFARAGFVFVAVDVRGRGDSGGDFTPWAKEGQDGYDAVEWVAAQPFSNGRVGMWGSSYGGFNQWATAALAPPHLRSIQPAAAGLPGFDFPLNRNVMRPYAASWLSYVSGRTGHNAFFGDLGYQADAYERVIRSGRAEADLDAELGFPIPAWRDFLAHPSYDAWWRALSPALADYRRIRIPALSITGQWDGAQPSALEHWRRSRSALDRADQFLIIGPFDHAGTRFPSPKVGGVAVPASGVLDMMALDLAWFDWTLRDGPRPAFLQDRVAYYLLGEDRWRYAPDLDRVADGRARFWLGQGTIGAARPPRALARYRDDPADLSRFRLGTWLVGDWLLYDKDVQGLGDRGLIYLSAPLLTPLAIVGRPRITLPIAIETPDADVRVRLYEVDAAGGSLLLAQDRIRARWRQSLDRPAVTVAGRRYLYAFDQMTWLSRVVPAGHRLRVVVDAPASVYDQRNFNSGKEVARETLADARAGTVTVFEGGPAGASLELPTLSPAGAPPR